MSESDMFREYDDNSNSQLENTSERRGYYRTGLQAAILYVVTFGFYFPYWLIRSRYAASRRLNIAGPPWFFWLWLVVPIAFLYPIFSTYSLLERSCRTRLPQTRMFSFTLFGILFAISLGLFRLPEPYDLFGFSAALPIAAMQHYSYLAESAGASPTPRQKRFHWSEWIILHIG